MADRNIDTGSPQYATNLADFNRITGQMRGDIVRWQKLTDATAQQAWRDADPLLNACLNFIEWGNNEREDF
jgi:hypothetical protein